LSTLTGLGKFKLAVNKEIIQLPVLKRNKNMYDCNCLIHPFQNDPGTSQNERVMDDLLSGAAKIDARTLADLLDFFMQMSRHINFYDKQLAISDWQPFFQKSIPFTLASIIKNPSTETSKNFAYYNSLFEKKPSSTGLQLQAYFIYYRFINQINNWYLAVKDSALPIESFLQILIKDKLQQPLKLFISYANAGVKFYATRKIDFSKLAENTVWNLQAADLFMIDNSFQTGTISKFQQIKNLYQKFQSVSPPFFDAIKIISTEAENNLEPSLLPLKDELQKKHPPHLGLLFAFLNIFRQLQNDLNGYTRKHLDFFYKDVLQFKSREAVPDKAYVIFEIQKQLEKYLVKKGLLVKDGKDNNKQEILFSLDDDIVVNKTQVAEVKTLFLNNQSTFEQTYVEGVYIANDATKANGTDKNFKDDEPANFSTLGAKLSKYSDPETKIIQPYPNARLGFILASPVLYLKEGTRKVDITLACTLSDSVCADIGNAIVNSSKNCCDDIAAGGSGNTASQNPYPDFLANEIIFSEIQNRISKQYIYLNEDIFKQAVSKGLDEIFIQQIRDKFLRIDEPVRPCYCEVTAYKMETSVLNDDWKLFVSAVVSDPNKRKITDSIFRPENILTVLFSGEKDWLQPASCDIAMSNLTGSNFVLTISAAINAEQEAVSFYSKQTFNEDLDTTHPVVKIELNERIKFSWKIMPTTNNHPEKCCEQDKDCCLLKNDDSGGETISFYQFFRNIKILENIGTNKTRIDVKVCGLKNFIVQNDESLQDVNGPVYPFGVRPRIESNFYIGSEEIFLKKWSDIIINLNWKDLPPVPTSGDFGKPFQAYYNGYQDFYITAGVQDKVVEDDKFRVQIAILQDGKWIYRTPLTGCDALTNSEWALFQKEADVVDIGCADDKNYSHQFAINNQSDFSPAFPNPSEAISFQGIKKYDVNSRHSFIRITLKCQDFQHDRYAFILARQMSAFGKLPDIVDGAVYYGVTIPGPPPVFTTLDLPVILQQIIDNYNLSVDAGPPAFDLAKNSRDLINEIIARVRASGKVNAAIWNNLFLIDNPATFVFGDPTPFPPPPLPLGLNESNSFYYDRLSKIFTWLKNLKEKIEQLKDKGVVIPNEPWTPIISNMSLDYMATATLEDIDLVHLYPFPGSYKHEEIKLQPTLFPTLCDEGTLFLGLKNLVPGENLNILFQLAEATSDSESEKEEVQWHYLDNNVWKPLRQGFEVLNDATENLTSSGIIKFALPANMTIDNTIMPKDLYWIKASVPQNSKAVSEAIAILPQAISVTFTNDNANDKLRLSEPLTGGSISKLNVADANIKSVQQPYDSFGGEVPEIEQQFYVRVSEQLRHKGRAIQKFDYERLALQQFPQLFKAKCINHSFALDAHLYKNDFPYAPGYIILAVIPDLNKLQAGNSFEPKVPVSILEKIESFIRKRTSPFVRFRAMNPRYEKINFCLRVNLLRGKDENFYKEQLKEDLKELLAPWAVGKYHKLTFGQCVYRSDIIRFFEQSGYVDFITDFRMAKQSQEQTPDSGYSKICPDTARSILVAGDIEVCINNPGCDDWRLCYDEQQQKIDCCTNPLMPVENYCKELRLR